MEYNVAGESDWEVGLGGRAGGSDWEVGPGDRAK